MNLPSESFLLKEKVQKNLLYISLFGIVMLFAGLTSAYIVRQADGLWMRFTMPFWFWVSSALILVSSGTMIWAVNAAKRNSFNAVKVALGITILLGIGFCFTQFWGWQNLHDAGIFFSGKSSNPSGSFLYVITFMHLLHILSGLIYLLVIFGKALKNKYNSSNYTGVKHSAIYWHFLDALWIYLFLFLLSMQ